VQGNLAHTFEVAVIRKIRLIKAATGFLKLFNIIARNFPKKIKLKACRGEVLPS